MTVGGNPLAPLGGGAHSVVAIADGELVYFVSQDARTGCTDRSSAARAAAVLDSFGRALCAPLVNGLQQCRLAPSPSACCVLTLLGRSSRDGLLSSVWALWDPTCCTIFVADTLWILRLLAATFAKSSQRENGRRLRS